MNRRDVLASAAALSVFPFAARAAETREEGVALVLAAPEFQRR